MKICRQNVLIVLLLIVCCKSYLEFTLVRVQGKANPNNNEQACIDQKTQHQYQQLCYDKDISYVIQLQMDRDLYYLAVDLTTPISWLKGHKCVLSQSKKKCSLINKYFKGQLKQLQQVVSNIGSGIKNRFKKNPVSPNNGQYAAIQGSTQIVKGYIQKVDKIQFTIVDSGRLTRFLDILMLGFYILGEKDQIKLVNTNFINATEISTNLNELQDGAISLRFDESSEKSFLQEIFDCVKSSTNEDQQFVTVFLGHDVGRNNTITIGDISVKNSQGGYSSINWIQTQEFQKYGKTPSISKIIIANAQDQDKIQQIQVALVQIIFTLSASYISLPISVIQSISAKLAKFAICEILPKQLYLQCEVKKQAFYSQQVIFDLDTGKISFTMKDLVYNKGIGKKVHLNIRKSYHQNVAIFGEPIFKKYFILFDFKKNAIGIAPIRTQFNTEIISIVSLIRFVTFTFFLGCCFLICFFPIKRMISVLGRANLTKSGPEGRRLRSYSPLQENPYDDIKGKIQQALNSNKQDQLEGI